MDPNATLRTMLDAIASGEHREATESADYLLDWLRGDGFMPDLCLSKVELIELLSYAVIGFSSFDLLQRIQLP